MNRLSEFTMDVASPEDVAELIECVRDEDAEEIRMLGESTVEEAIRQSAGQSNAAFSARIRGKLLCLFGVLQTSDDSAVIWEIGTNAVRENASSFLDATPHMLALATGVAPQSVSTFVNCLPEEYSTYRKWLERHAGAVFDDAPFASKTGAMFRRFVIRRKGD